MSHGQSKSSTTVLTPRSLHLLDVENLVGGYVTTQSSLALLDAYQAQVHIGPADLIVTGVSRRFGATWLFNAPRSWRHLLGTNAPDAADLVLLEAARGLRLGTFSALVIASGDGAFCATAGSARDLGLTVVCVQGRGRMAARLRSTSSTVIGLTLPRRTAAPPQLPDPGSRPSRSAGGFDRVLYERA